MSAGPTFFRPWHKPGSTDSTSANSSNQSVDHKQNQYVDPEESNGFASTPEETDSESSSSSMSSEGYTTKDSDAEMNTGSVDDGRNAEEAGDNLRCRTSSESSSVHTTYDPYPSERPNIVPSISIPSASNYSSFQSVPLPPPVCPMDYLRRSLECVATAFKPLPSESTSFVPNNHLVELPKNATMPIPVDEHALHQNLYYGLPMMHLPLAPSPMEQAVHLVHRQDAAAKQMKKMRPKKFRCEYCDVAFSNNGQLKGHIRIHTGERPFKCTAEGCGKSFTRNEELTRHKRIHTGQRPHACMICGKCFGRKDHLKKHTRTHENRDPYRASALGVFALGHGLPPGLSAGLPPGLPSGLSPGLPRGLPATSFSSYVYPLL